MKRSLQSLIAVSASVIAVVAPESMSQLAAQSVPELKYEANAAILSLPAYGEVAGVATNSKGHIFVYARTGHPVATLGDERTFYHGNARLFEFDPTGRKSGHVIWLGNRRTTLRSSRPKEIPQGTLRAMLSQLSVNPRDL